MPYRIVPFVSESYYHIYNRGVEKRLIFQEDRDYRRFLHTIYYYQFDNLKVRFSYKDFPLNKDFDQNPKLVEIICYCLMPNHFHLLVKQVADNGVHKFMRKSLNSYTKYFNTKYRRVGPLLQGQFKAVPVKDNSQLLQVCRYIHLNPYVSGLTTDLVNYRYSSYPNYVSVGSSFCNKEPILGLFKGLEDYQTFVVEHKDYAKELEIIKHLLIEEE